jgi:hypothetical protein
MQLAIKEIIQERARQVAEEYKEKFFYEQKREYEELIAEYEELLTEYYQLEIKLNFFRAMDKLDVQYEKRKELDELMQRDIVLLKRIKDIENSGVLEKYDAVVEAIKAINKE